MSETLKEITKDIDANTADVYTEKKSPRSVDIEGKVVEDFEVYEQNIYNAKVSVNFPLQRLFSGILQAFGAYPEDSVDSFLRRIRDIEDLPKLADGIVTCLATLASIQCGMWARNGVPVRGRYMIYNHYHKCPSLKPDDLILLQAVACLDPEGPGRIVMTLLQRFRLLKWSSGFKDDSLDVFNDDVLKDTTKMAEHGLQLIISMICERTVKFVGKVGDREELKNRIIQLLASASTPHSKVISLLEVQEEEMPFVDDVLNEVAKLTPSTEKKGVSVYELLPEFRPDFNPFYYFYTAEQKSKAWDLQMRLKRTAKERLVFTPPKQPALNKTFEKLIHIASTAPVMQLIYQTLTKASSLGKPRTDGKKNDGHKLITSKILSQVCYLILQGYQDDIHYEKSDFTSTVEKLGIPELIAECIKAASATESENPDLFTVDVRESLAMVLEQAVSARKTVLKNVTSSMEDDEASQQGPSAVDEVVEAQQRKRRAELAKSRRNKIMAQMSALQSKFAEEHKDDLKDMNQGSTDDDGKDQMMDICVSKVVALGKGRTVEPLREKVRLTCILCQDTSELSHKESAKIFVSPAFVQKSTVFSQRNCRTETGKLGKLTCRDDFLPAHLDCSPSVQSCGHPMHVECYQGFFNSLVKKEHARQLNSVFHYPLNFDVDKQEFLCPICENLSNSVLPLTPQLDVLMKPGHENASSGGGLYPDFVNGSPAVKHFESWVDRLKKLGDTKFDDSTFKWRDVSLTERNTVLEDMIEIFAMNVCQNTAAENGPTSKADSSNDSVFLLPTQATAFEIYHNLALAQQGQTLKNAFEAIPERKKQVLKALIRTQALLPLVLSLKQPYFNKGENFAKIAKVLYAALFSHRLIGSGKGENSSTFSWDPLNLLVVLSASHLSLTVGEEEEMKGKESAAFLEYEHHIIKAVVIYHVIQIFLSWSNSPVTQSTTLPSTSNGEAEKVSKIFHRFQNVVNDSKEVVPAEVVLAELESRLSFFIQSATFFVHLLTDVPLPPSSTDMDGMLQYLGLESSLGAFISSPGVCSVIDSIIFSGQLERLNCSLPPRIGKLLTLPETYNGVIDKVENYSCPNSVTGGSKYPAICLICGKIMCSQSYCCEEKIQGTTYGGCSAHAQRCCAGNGLFLIIRRCEVILMSNGKGMDLPAPYVDRYGETDKGMRRGNPLKLNAEMFAELDKLWTTNTIAQKISHAFDAEVMTFTRPWNVI